MKRLLILLCAVLAISCTERLTPEGDVITQSRTFNTAVNILKVADGIEAYCDNELPDGTVEVTTNSNIHPYVEVLTDDGALIIRLKRGFRYNHLTVKVHLSANLFDMFDASGGSKIICDQIIDRENLIIGASGGSIVDCEENILCTNLNISASGGSEIEVNGMCKKLNAYLSGGSELEADELLAVSVLSYMSGGSRMSIIVEESLVVNASGGSEVYYSGSPSELVSNLSGGSQVVKK